MKYSFLLDFNTILSKIYSFSFLLIIGIGYSCSSTKGSKAVQTKLHLNDGKGAYTTGQYRNLFKKAGHTEEEITQKIDAAFQQLFHGDSATQAVYFSAGKNANGPLAY